MKMRKDKDIKRRLAFQKQNVKKEKNMTMYGAESGAAVVVGKTVEFNRRFLAAILAMVFVLTSLVVGVNIIGKADTVDGYTMHENFDSQTGLVLRKGLKQTAGANTSDTSDDVFSLRMEAYATNPIAQKVIENDIPLDVVMVLDQSNSMTANDVWTGKYNDVKDENGESKTSFNITDANGKYYQAADGEYYQLSYDTNDDAYAVVQNDTGSVKNDWTAANAVSTKNSLGNRGLYYNDNGTYREVKGYTNNVYNVQSSKIIDLADIVSATGDLNGPHYRETDYYVYVPHSDSTNEIDGDHSCWHRVYYSVQGVAIGGSVTGKSLGGHSSGGYYFTFYYYTNSLIGPTGGSSLGIFSSDNAKAKRGDTITSNGQTVTLLSNFEEGGITYRVLWFSVDNLAKSWTNTKANGSNGYLYKLGNNSSVNNYLYTGDIASPTNVIVCQAPGSTGSHTYTGPLYTKGYKLYYQTDPDDPTTKHYIGNPVYKQSDTAYEDTLYTKDTITRLEAQKTAATTLAEQLSNNENIRIAVVSNAGNGTGVYTGGKTVDDPFATDSADITTAISTLTDATANGTTLADGLAKAEDVFEANRYEDVNDRKRIVITFTDDVSIDSTTELNAATLKDKSNASVYVIGYNNSAIGTDLEHLSSNYFSAVAAPTIYTLTNDGKTYYYQTADQAAINSAFGSVTVTIPSPTTKFTLSTANAILRDVVSKNFVVPDDFAQKITAYTLKASLDQDGKVTSWDDKTTFALTEGTNLTKTSNTDGTTTIGITGFDYSKYYVSNDNTANDKLKLVVEISGLKLSNKVKTDSDKRIYSNTTDSAIYKDGNEQMKLTEFPRPFWNHETHLAPAGGTGLKDDTSGIVVNKYLTTKENGNYDLTVEAYTTTTATTKIEKVPTDFIVVADQSGSMSTTDMATDYSKVSSATLSTISSSSKGYYYYDGTNYYRVYPVKGYLYEYFAENTKWAKNIIEDGGMDLSWFQDEEEATYGVANQYFYKTTDGVYRPVSVSATGVLGAYYVKLYYKNASGETVYFTRPTYPVYKNVFGSGKYQYGDLGYRAINSAVTGFYNDKQAYTYSTFVGVTTGMYINYPMYKRHVGYTELRYRDVNGEEHTVPASNGSTTWEYCNSSGQALTTASGSTQPSYSNLYTEKGTNQSRLAALKGALTEFVTAVANEEDDVNGSVDNRIAIVGFSSDGYNNTELLTGTNLTVKNNNGVQKANAGTSDYATALVNATNGNVGTVNSKLTNAINALTANGGTQPEDGLEMALEILRNRSDKTYEVQTSDPKKNVDRNVFVIFFTDGQPGNNDYVNRYKEANDVVEMAKQIKGYKVEDASVAAEDKVTPSLFSIGVFGESDGNPLTYVAHETKSKNIQYEYELGWVETIGSYTYLNRNWMFGDEANYGKTPNDTIYDYMSVVSSNYPNAEEFMKIKTSNTAGEADTNGYKNYLAMVNGVRKDYIGVNNYYRMASNQSTLVAAFNQAVTMSNTVLSGSSALDANSVMKDIFDNTYFTPSSTTSVNASTVDGTMDENGIVTFKESTKTPASVISRIADVSGKSTVTVTGFDYLANYINYGTYKENSTEYEIPPHDGKKLVVTITDVVPTGETGKNLYSNIYGDSSMYIKDNTAGEAFPHPYISSQKVTLDVGKVNKKATFDVTAVIVDSTDKDVAKNSDDLDEVMIVYPDGTTRKPYSATGDGVITFSGMKNGESFYVENLPTGYSIKTTTTTTDDSYTYSIWDDTDSTKTSMVKDTPVEKTFDYTKDHTIYVNSVALKRKVTIRERTIGSYANVNQAFDESITLNIPAVEGYNDSDTTFPVDCTFRGKSYTATFAKDTAKSNKYTIVATLTSIAPKNSSDPAITVTNGSIPMRDTDVLIMELDAGTTVIVQEGDSHEHDVFYYHGEDNVDKTSITLRDADGNLLEGKHTITLQAVDGTEEDDVELKFEDGIITNNVYDSDDLGFYQRAICDDDLTNAMLDINGVQFSFTSETEEVEEGSQEEPRTAYVATIKPNEIYPPVSVTIERNDLDILILNRFGDILIEGIYDLQNHNKVIYIILGSLAAVSAAAGGAYVYRSRKKKED